MSWNEQEEMDNDLLAHHDYAGSPGRLSPHTQALCLSAADQPLPTPNFRHSGIQALPDPPLWYQSPTPLLYCLAKVPRWLATNPRDASGASSGPESQISQPTRRATLPRTATRETTWLCSGKVAQVAIKDVADGGRPSRSHAALRMAASNIASSSRDVRWRVIMARERLVRSSMYV
jgi:hypothetical protein